jgi:arylsulfatase A-like enzyme
LCIKVQDDNNAQTETLVSSGADTTMNANKKRYRLGFLAVVLAIAQSPTLGASPAGEPATPPPNVIYILADDAGINNFGAYGGKLIRTPNIDQLAADGLRFTQHYAGSTLCAPSRSVLMTGKHTGNTRIRHNRDLALLDDDVTVAELFQQAGYTTGMIGKWGLGEAGSTGVPNRQGFDYFFGYLNHANAHRYYPEYLWRNDNRVDYPNNLEQRNHYSHDLIAEEALAFLERNQQRPFFLYLAFTIPHVDLDVPEDSLQAYRGKLGEDERPLWAADYRRHPTPKAALAGMISRMDTDVGRVMAKLEQLGLAENTLVMFTSDNGPSAEGAAPVEFFDSNGIFRGGKRDFYEGGIRMPFIARWPAEIKPGRVSDHVSGFQDFLPTMAQLLDIDTPAGIDGISFLPELLAGQTPQQRHDYLYWELESKLPLNAEKQALLQNPWKLLRLKRWLWWTEYELYRLDTDPSEQHNLAEEYPDKVAELAQLMDNTHHRNEDYPLRHYRE